jgi:hypothetical protein
MSDYTTRIVGDYFRSIGMDKIEVKISWWKALIIAPVEMALGFSLLWWLAHYVVQPDYQPNEHFFEFGAKFGMLQDGLLYLLSYPVIMRSIPVVAVTLALIVDGFWQMQIFLTNQTAFSVNEKGVSGFRFWVPVSMAWADVQCMERTVIGGGLSETHLLTFVGKDGFGTAQSEFPFIRLMKPRLNVPTSLKKHLSAIEAYATLLRPGLKRVQRNVKT